MEAFSHTSRILRARPSTAGKKKNILLLKEWQDIKKKKSLISFIVPDFKRIPKLNESPIQ